MKKLISVCIVCCVFLYACKQNMLDSYNQAANGKGTVTIRIGNGGRAAGYQADGFPDLTKTDIEIKASYTGGSVFAHKTISPQDSKEFTVSADIGKEITVSIIITAGSSVWQGDAVHTVTAGTNNVSIKIKKAPRSIGKFLYSFGSGSNDPVSFALTPALNWQKIKPRGSLSGVSFCRGKNGGIYSVYLPSDATTAIKFERYNSDGSNAASFTVDAGSIPFPFYSLAADFTTGAVYALNYDTSPTTAGSSILNIVSFEESAGRRLIPVTDNCHFFKKECKIFAVDNNTIFYIGNEADGSQKLFTASIQKHHHGSYTIEDKTQYSIELGQEQNTDIMVKDGVVYLLAASTNKDKGKLLRYTYNAEKKEWESAGVYGYADTPPVNNIQVIDEAKEFRNPIRFIGFEGNTVYIADDGIEQQYYNSKIRNIANRDRIAAFDTVHKTLSFTPAPNQCTWQTHEASPYTDNPLVFFTITENKGKTPKELSYTRVMISDTADGANGIELVSESNPVLAFLTTSSAHGSTAFLEKPFYAFDKDKNLYLAANTGLQKYRKQNGHYEQDSSFTGNWKTSLNPTLAPLIQPVYDLAQEKLYAKFSSDKSLIYFSESGWKDVNYCSTGELTNITSYTTYTIYNNTLYGFKSGSNDLFYHQIIEEVASSSSGNFKVEAQHSISNAFTEDSSVRSMYAADDVLYLLNTKTAAANRKSAVIRTLKISNTAALSTAALSESIEIPLSNGESVMGLYATGYRNKTLYFALKTAVSGTPASAENHRIKNYLGVYTAESKTVQLTPVPAGITWE